MTTVMVDLHCIHSSHGMCRGVSQWLRSWSTYITYTVPKDCAVESVNDYGNGRPILHTLFSRTALWSQLMTTVLVNLYYTHKYCSTSTVPPRWQVNTISAVLRLLIFQVCSNTHIKAVCSHTTSVMEQVCVLQEFCAQYQHATLKRSLPVKTSYDNKLPANLTDHQIWWILTLKRAGWYLNFSAEFMEKHIMEHKNKHTEKNAFCGR